MKKLWAASVCAGAVLLCACSPAGNTGDGQNSGVSPEKSGGNSEIILATTTSTKDSGLLDEILPVFEKETGYSVSVVSVGSGEAMTMGDRIVGMKVGIIKQVGTPQNLYDYPCNMKVAGYISRPQNE